MGEITPPTSSSHTNNENTSLNVSNIPNLDGNDSIISNNFHESQPSKIPVLISYTVHCQTQSKQKPNLNNLKTIRRSNKAIHALNLPQSLT